MNKTKPIDHWPLIQIISRTWRYLLHDLSNILGSLPDHFRGTYHHEFPKTGQHRAKFLIQCVQDLRASLKKRGSQLIVRSDLDLAFFAQSKHIKLKKSATILSPRRWQFTIRFSLLRWSKAKVLLSLYPMPLPKWLICLKIFHLGRVFPFWTRPWYSFKKLVLLNPA